MKQLLVFLSIVLIVPSLRAQKTLPTELSPNAKIYLITCGPGNEIWSHFGHTGIRVQDPKFDITFNYGMFDYTDPDFVMKFAKRTMNYFLSVSPTQPFIDLYIDENRYVYQEELLLNLEQKQEMYANLVNNFNDPEQRYYLYEFFFDNCATRPRDQIEMVTSLNQGAEWATHPDAESLTFRDLIDEGFQATPWVDFGIDLVLGSHLDRPVTNRELMFLPIYLSEIGQKTSIDGKALFGPKVYLHEVEYHQPEASWLTPSVVFWTLFILIFVLSVFQQSASWLKYVDVVFFLVFGVLGIFLLFMWFGTEHQGTKANYNLIWATPLHLFSIVLIFWKGLLKRIPQYFLVIALILLGLIISFWLLPQEFHPAVKPIVLLLAFRYYALHRLNQRKLLFRST